jgi:hypothetical protein
MENKKRMMLIGGAMGLAGLYLWLWSRSAKGEPPPPPPGMGNLWGLVIDSETGDGIEGVSVILNGLGVMTDSTGRYELLELSLGDYGLTATKTGYEPWDMQITINEGNNQRDIAMIPFVGPTLYDSLTVPAQYLTEIHSVDGIPFSEVGQTTYNGKTMPYARLATPIVSNSPVAIDLDFVWRNFLLISGVWHENNAWAYASGDSLQFQAMYSNPGLAGGLQPILFKQVNPQRISDGQGGFYWNLPVTGHVILNQLAGGATIYWAQATYDILLGTPAGRPDYGVSSDTCVILGAVQVLTAGSLNTLPPYSG